MSLINWAPAGYLHVLFINRFRVLVYVSINYSSTRESSRIFHYFHERLARFYVILQGFDVKCNRYREAYLHFGGKMSILGHAVIKILAVIV